VRRRRIPFYYFARARRACRNVLFGHDHPHDVALGAAIGVFVGLLPILGVQMPIIILITIPLRASLVAALLSCWILNPLTIVPIYLLEFVIGTTILRIENVPLHDVFTILRDNSAWNAGRHLLTHFAAPMLLGGAVLGLVFSLPAYFLTRQAVLYARRRFRPRRRNPRIILASASPRRKTLLRRAHFRTTVIPADIDEESLPGLTPAEHALHLACRKARTVAADVDEGLVLGADTVVALGDRAIGKPVDADHARRILSELSGSTHECVTALCLIDKPSGLEFSDVTSTKIFMNVLTPGMIEEYIASGEFQGKAGAFGIREKNDPFVREIHGDFSNVVGLPIETLRGLIARRDACLKKPSQGGPL